MAQDSYEFAFRSIPLACAAFAAACENNGEATMALQEIIGAFDETISSKEGMVNAVKKANSAAREGASPIGVEEKDGQMITFSWSAGGRAAVRLALGTEEGILILSSAQPQMGSEWLWREAALRRAEAAILAAENEMAESGTIHTEELERLRVEASEEAEAANAASEEWRAAFAARPPDQDDVLIVRRGMAVEEEEAV